MTGVTSIVRTLAYITTFTSDKHFKTINNRKCSLGVVCQICINEVSQMHTKKLFQTGVVQPCKGNKVVHLLCCKIESAFKKLLKA